MVFAAVLTAFVVAIVPAVVLVAVWVAVMAFRLLRPERPLPFLPDAAAARREATARGASVPVGFREIHEDLRTHARALPIPHHDSVADGLHPVSEPWMDDLHRRRN